MRGVAPTPRSFDPTATARWLLVAAAWMAGLGLVNIYFLTASTLENVFFFGVAGLCLIGAAEVKWLLPRLIQRGNAKL
jgi:hypothetical protein